MTPDFGAFVISLDFELHWGVRDKTLPDVLRRKLLGNTGAVLRLLDLFHEFDIAATWATVGFLFAHSRAELDAYSPQLRPTYTNRSLYPYSERVGVDESDDPLHFAPSLINSISALPRQEIATHTYSHFYCLEAGQTKAQFEADLLSALAIARHSGVKISSLVFPRNQVNADYIDILERHGIIAYRGNEAGWMYQALPHSEKQTPGKRCARLIDSYFSLTGANLSAWGGMAVSRKICNIPCSRYLRPYSPGLRWAEKLRLKRICDDISLAALTRQIYHLWWHPHDIAIHLEENLELLKRILRQFAECQERYGMRSLNMAETASIELSLVQPGTGPARGTDQPSGPLIPAGSVEEQRSELG